MLVSAVLHAGRLKILQYPWASAATATDALNIKHSVNAAGNKTWHSLCKTDPRTESRVDLKLQILSCVASTCWWRWWNLKLVDCFPPEVFMYTAFTFSPKSRISSNTLIHLLHWWFNQEGFMSFRLGWTIHCISSSLELQCFVSGII